MFKNIASLAAYQVDESKISRNPKPFDYQVTASRVGGTADVAILNTKQNLLAGLIDDKASKQGQEYKNYGVFEDIYYHDAVCGGYVDLISNLPFSDFTLSGVQDPAILRTFKNELENLRYNLLLQDISRDYLIYGAHISCFSVDPKNNRLQVLPLDIKNCTFTPLPVYSMDPVVDYSFNEIDTKFRKMLNSGDQRILKKLQHLPDWYLNGLKAGKVELDPDNVLYIPRRSFSRDNLGTSCYERCLPFYILEKALFRGTIIQAYRRQRSIGHITAGDEEWEPTEEDLRAITDLFLSADKDPIGSIVTTRNGIQYSDVRIGGDFWRYDEVADTIANLKMRALGINESILSSDTSFSTLDAALSIFIDQLKAYRHTITRELFYDRIFPMISQLHGFTKKLEVTGALEVDAGGDYKITCGLYDSSQNKNLHIPKVQWHKQLEPRGDRDYLDMLQSLTDMGIPVPLRIIASAGGQDIDEILAALKEDKKIREKLKEFGAEGEEDAAGGIFSSGRNRDFEALKELTKKDRDDETKINKNIASSLEVIAKKAQDQENQDHKMNGNSYTVS
jgi:hypothetical protein